jgi:hypothetical protein
MKIRLVCLVAALLAVVFTRPVAAADVSCAQWLAYRVGDTDLHGQGLAFAAFLQGYIDAVNEYSDLLNRNVVLFNPNPVSKVPPSNFVPPQATFENTAASLDRLCSVDPTESAVAIGVNDVHTEMMRRAGPIINSMRMRKMKMRHYAVPPPRIISPAPSPAISPAATCRCAGPSLAER